VPDREDGLRYHRFLIRTLRPGRDIQGLSRLGVDKVLSRLANSLSGIRLYQGTKL
jgi:hypothetical protein